jgi:hypothetical protein
MARSEPGPGAARSARLTIAKRARPAGDPVTSWGLELSGLKAELVEPRGIEPLTS